MNLLSNWSKKWICGFIHNLRVERAFIGKNLSLFFVSELGVKSWWTFEMNMYELILLCCWSVYRFELWTKCKLWHRVWHIINNCGLCAYTLIICFMYGKEQRYLHPKLFPWTCNRLLRLVIIIETFVDLLYGTTKPEREVMRF